MAEDTKTPQQLVQERITERVGGLTVALQASVVDHYVAKEEKRRADLLLRGYDKVNSLTAELAKINKPDLVGFDANGQPVSQNYSQAKIAEMKKAREKLQKLTAAFEQAFGGGPFEPLEKALQGGDDAGERKPV